MGGQILGRALGIEDETMGDQVMRSEVGLRPAAPKLGEIGVGRELKHLLEHVAQNRLGEQLLVLA